MACGYVEFDGCDYGMYDNNGTCLPCTGAGTSDLQVPGTGIPDNGNNGKPILESVINNLPGIVTAIGGFFGGGGGSNSGSSTPNQNTDYPQPDPKPQPTNYKPFYYTGGVIFFLVIIVILLTLRSPKPAAN
jgi:hypothetical protein